MRWHGEAVVPRAGAEWRRLQWEMDASANTRIACRVPLLRRSWEGVFFVHSDAALNPSHRHTYHTLKLFFASVRGARWPRWPADPGMLTEHECGCSLVQERFWADHPRTVYLLPFIKYKVWSMKL